MRRRDFLPMMNCQSIAIVGASDDREKLSGRVLLNLRRFGYRGRIHPVNPNRATVQGESCNTSIAEIGAPVDLVIIVSPVQHTLAAVKEAIACGNTCFAIYSAGFAELNEEGAKTQLQIVALIDEAGGTLLGPNCAGFISSHANICATFSTVAEQLTMRPGGLSFAGQSGAMGAYWLHAVEDSGLGFAKWLSVGNEGGIDLADAVESFATDPLTQTICLYVEGVRDGTKIRRAFNAASRARKPVLVLRSGRTEAGASAAASHTGAIASENAVWSAVLEQDGVVDCVSLGEMIDVARFFETRPATSAHRPLIMSVSGGAGALIADAVSENELVIQALSPDLRASLRAALPSFGELHNPLDLTGGAAVSPAIFRAAAEAVARDTDRYDSYILFFGLMSATYQEILAIAREILLPLGRPLAIVWMGASADMLEAFGESGLAIYPDIPCAVRAMTKGGKVIDHWATSSDHPAPAAYRPRHTGERLSEAAAHALLASDIPLDLPGEWLIDSPTASLPQAIDTGKYAVKLQSGALAHKSDHDAVRLNLRGREETAREVARQFALGESLDVPIDGVLVQQMVPHSHELIVGLRCDAQFGPVLLLGRGGTEAEYEKDLILRLLPIDQEGILEALGALRYHPRLLGVRGREGVNLNALASALTQLCELYLRREDISEIEINPLGVATPATFTMLDLVITMAQDAK